MVRFRTRTRASHMVKIGPFHLKVGKSLGRRGMRVSAGTRRPWHRGRLSLGASRRAGGRKRRWR